MNTDAYLFENKTKKFKKIEIKREKKISINYKFVISLSINAILIFILFFFILKNEIFKKSNLKLTSGKTIQ